MTLHANSRLRFTPDEVAGQAAACSSGFHEAEESGIWTERHAVVSFRLGDEALTRLTIGLHGLPFFDPPHVRILVVGSDWLEFELRNADLELEVPLPASARAGQTITIIVSAPDAAKPANISKSLDGRLLGVKILWVSAS